MRSVVPPVHPDRLIPLKEVLNISDHQLAQWTKFHATVDATTRVIPPGAAPQLDPAQTNYPSLPKAIDNELHQHLVRVEACRALQERVTALYEVLSDQQRMLANRLLVPLVRSVMACGPSASATLPAERNMRAKAA